MAENETLELIITARDMATAAINNVVSRLASLHEQVNRANTGSVGGVGAALAAEAIRGEAEISAAKIKAAADVRAAKMAIGNDEVANARRVASAEVAAAEDVAIARIRAETRYQLASVAADATISAQDRQLANARILADADVRIAKARSATVEATANNNAIASGLEAERRAADEKIKEAKRVEKEKTDAAKRAANEEEKAAKRAAQEAEKAERDALRSRTSALANFGRAWQSVLQGIGMAVGFNVMNLGRQLADGLMEAVTAGMQFNDLIFKLNVGFTAITKDAGFAKTMVQDLFEFAARTPATFEQVATAAQRLMAYGWEKGNVLDTLKIVTDAATALGRDEYTIDHLVRALGQMQNKGHVMTQEMIQFSEAGINAWQYLADTLNVDVATAMSMVENRAVDSGTAIAGILSGMKRDFGGMAEELNKSVGGLWTSVQDYSKQILAVVFKPTYDGIKDMLYDFALNTLPTWLEDVKKAQAGNKAVAEAGKADAGMIAASKGVTEPQKTFWEVVMLDPWKRTFAMLTDAWQAGSRLFALTSAGYLGDVLNEALGAQFATPSSATKYREYLTNLLKEQESGLKGLQAQADRAVIASPALQELIANAEANVAKTKEELGRLDTQLAVSQRSSLTLANGGMSILNDVLRNTRPLVFDTAAGLIAMVSAMTVANPEAQRLAELIANIKNNVPGASGYGAGGWLMTSADRLTMSNPASRDIDNATVNFMNKYNSSISPASIARSDALWKALGVDISNAEGELSAFGIALQDALASGAPEDAIAAIREEIQKLTSDIAIYKKAWALVESGQMSLDAVDAYVKAQQEAASKIAAAFKTSAKESTKAYEKEFGEFKGKVSGLLSPTSVTAGDMFKTKTGMFGGYQDKWDEYIRRLEAGVNGSKEWAYLVPENVRKMNDADRQAWLSIQKEQFYGGYMQNADWTKGGINWGAFVQSYSQSVLDEAQKQKLVDQALAELNKAGFQGNAEDVRVALGFSTGGEKGARSYAEGFSKTIKESNIPAATAATLSEQTVANKEKFYAAGAAISPVVWDGIVNGTSQDLVGMMANKLVEPVANRIIKRYGLGSGAQP